MSHQTQVFKLITGIFGLFVGTEVDVQSIIAI